MTVRLFTGSSEVFIPTNEKTRTGFSEVTLREYFPSISVNVPCVVPFSDTVAPGIPSPSDSETTVPVTNCCAIALPNSEIHNSVKNRIFRIVFDFLVKHEIKIYHYPTVDLFKTPYLWIYTEQVFIFDSSSNLKNSVQQRPFEKSSQMYQAMPTGRPCRKRQWMYFPKSFQGNVGLRTAE